MEAPINQLLRLDYQFLPERVGDLLIKEETIPVFFEGQVIAVISRHRNAEHMRSPGKLELNYREIANHLYQMVAEGNFPYQSAGSLFEPVPRVGDGLIRLDVNGAISFASPNAKSAFSRLSEFEPLLHVHLVRR